MVIDIGPGATFRFTSEGFGGYYTFIDYNNPANGTGILVKAQFYFVTVNGAGVKVGTFSGSGTSWTYRAGATIGAVTKGSTQTFTGLSFSVSLNDCLGVYDTGGNLSTDNFGSGYGYKYGDHMTAEGEIGRAHV